MATTKAQQKAVAKYMKNNYDSFLVRVPKGQKATIDAHAKAKGESVNSLVNTLLRTDMGLSEAEWKQSEEE